MSKCRCNSRVEVRKQPEWNPCAWLLYGYGIAVRVRVHTGVCPLSDEVLRVWAIKVYDAA